MLKVLTALMVVLIPAAALAGPVDERGQWQPFKQEMVFEAQAVEMDGPLAYWVRPSEPFIDQTAKVVEDMRTPYIIDNPFMFKVQLAGLTSGSSSGMLLSEDGFEAEARKASRDELINHDYQFRCYGKYADVPMPVCSAIDVKGQSAGVDLVRKGIYMKDKTFDSLPSLEEKMMTSAQKAAEAEAIGIWKPFRFMLRGLQ